MIYEPENLKNKKAMYERRDKWLVRFIFLFWTVLLYIYANLVVPYTKSVVAFWGILGMGIVIISIVYFFILCLVLIHRGKQFRKMNNAIVRNYYEDKNGKLLLERLLAIDRTPKDMGDEMTWYLNVAIAFNALGRRNECISLLKQVEEIATRKEKEYVQFVKEQLQLEKNDTN